MTTDNHAVNMNMKAGKEHKRFSGEPGEPERLPEGAEQRASHCCRQKRQVSSTKWNAIDYNSGGQRKQKILATYRS